MPENLVTCHCQNCNGKIQFDTEQLGKDGTAIVECPHCKLETRLFNPRSRQETKSDNDFSIKFLARELAIKIYRAKGAERFERMIFGITRLFALFWAALMVLTLILLAVAYFSQTFGTADTAAPNAPPPSFTGILIQSERWAKFGIFFISTTIILTMLSIISIVLVLLTIERNSRKENESDT